MTPPAPWRSQWFMAIAEHAWPDDHATVSRPMANDPVRYKSASNRMRSRFEGALAMRAFDEVVGLCPLD